MAISLEIEKIYKMKKFELNIYINHKNLLYFINIKKLNRE